MVHGARSDWNALVRVLVANNYQLDTVLRLHLEGAWPREHLWGIGYLAERGHDVAVVPWSRDLFGAPLGPLERRLPRGIRAVMGPIGYESAVIRHSAGRDVLYSAHADTTQGIGLLRSIGLFRTAIVGVVHPEYVHSAWAARAIRSLDAVICLSERTAARVGELAGVPASRIHVLHWGPDLTFPGYRVVSGGEGVISSGKSRRDLGTLLSAALALPSVRFTLYGRADQAETGPNVVMTSKQGYRNVLGDIAASAVVAIPLPTSGGETTGTTGLSELNTALAMGKPVVMTRNPYIDMNVTGEGVGIEVEANDAEGWVRAIRQLVADPDAAREMGQRGRLFVEHSWNADCFEQGLYSVFQSLG